jgi:hypothetical protein
MLYDLVHRPDLLSLVLRALLVGVSCWFLAALAWAAWAWFIRPAFRAGSRE